MAFFGVCYSPYRIGSPDTWPSGQQPTADTVGADMATIAKRGFTHIRTYGVDKGNQWNVDKATQHNLTLGLGVWVGASDSVSTINAQIDAALRQAQTAANRYNRLLSLDLVVGNELDLVKPQPARIQESMKYARDQLPSYNRLKARVTTCFTGAVLEHTGSQWAYIVKDCQEVVYLTVYPWYGQKYNYDHGGTPFKPGNIDLQMQYSWDHGLRNTINWAGKKVVIAEIGWPSDGYAGTSVPDEQTNYGVTKKWVSTSHQYNGTIPPFDTYWFEMFDEPWKTAEGPWGRHWGLYTSGDNPQPKFQFAEEPMVKEQA